MESGSGFKDPFSGHSRDYARARPAYPESLFAHIASLATRWPLSLMLGRIE